MSRATWPLLISILTIHRHNSFVCLGTTVYICVICWIQVLLSRFGRHADHRILFEDAENETSSMGDYTSIQATHDYRATLQRKTTPIAPSQKRRRYGRETEPLLPADSLSKSVSIAVVPSIPEEPALKGFASAAGIGTSSKDDGGVAPSTMTSLPPVSQLITLMHGSLPTKSYIRSLKQIPNAFTQRDMSSWLKNTFPRATNLDESSVRDLVLTLLESGQILSATPMSTLPSEIELENALFVFSNSSEYLMLN